jgi:hypothetical protein
MKPFISCLQIFRTIWCLIDDEGTGLAERAPTGMAKQRLMKMGWQDYRRAVMAAAGGTLESNGLPEAFIKAADAAQCAQDSFTSPDGRPGIPPGQTAAKTSNRGRHQCFSGAASLPGLYQDIGMALDPDGRQARHVRRRK